MPMDSQISPVGEKRHTDVRLEYPRRDRESLALAAELAAAVRAELAGLENDHTFDEFLQRRRGRLWVQQESSQV
jgi:hypothetical protein